MKKITALLFLSLIFLTSSNIQALTIEEQTTISKLKSWGILEKQRLFSEYYKPMPTIDVLSLNIKSLSLLRDTYDKEFYALEENMFREFKKANKEILKLKKEKVEYKKDLEAMKKDSDRKDIGLLFLSLIAIGLNIFNK